MKGINAVAPLAVAFGASAVSASALPDTLIPSYFKRDSSLPQVTVKGNGTNTPLQPPTRNADLLSQLFSLETTDSTFVASTTSQEALQMLLTQLLIRVSAHVTLPSKQNKQTWCNTSEIDIFSTDSKNSRLIPCVSTPSTIAQTMMLV